MQLDFDDFSGERGAQLTVFIKVVEEFTKVMFAAEAAIKIVAKGKRPLEYFTDKEDGAFNCFDVGIVIASWALIAARSSAATISVMRLLRLVRVMRMFPELRVILKGILAGLRSVGSIMMLLLLIMCVGGGM